MTTRDAAYALMQRLGANGMTFAPSGGALSLAGAASATERSVFVRGPTLGPVRDAPTRLPRDLPVTWPASRRPTVAEMLIAARAIDTPLCAMAPRELDRWSARGRNSVFTNDETGLERAGAWARLFAATSSRR